MSSLKMGARKNSIPQDAKYVKVVYLEVPSRDLDGKVQLVKFVDFDFRGY